MKKSIVWILIAAVLLGRCTKEVHLETEDAQTKEESEETEKSGTDFDVTEMNETEEREQTSCPEKETIKGTDETRESMKSTSPKAEEETEREAATEQVKADSTVPPVTPKETASEPVPEKKEPETSKTEQETKKPEPTTEAPTVPTLEPEPETTAAPTETPTTAEPTTEPETAPVIDTAAYANQVIQLVNEERMRNGLPALTVDNRLMQAAKTRSDECAVLLGHTRPNGRSIPELIPSDLWLMGETVHGGGDASMCVKGWISSEMHYGIMMGQSVYIGVGCSVRSDGYIVYSALYADLK